MAWVIYASDGKTSGAYADLPSARKRAQAEADRTGGTSIVYPTSRTGKAKGKTHHVRPSKANPDSDLAQEAFAAGKDWWHHGQHSSGVANARVVRYGFLQWWNNQSPAATRGHSKAKYERAFREGWTRAKRSPNSRRTNPQAKLVKGVNLTYEQRRQVLQAYVNRYHAIGPGKHYKNDDEWVNDHAFRFTKTGRLSGKWAEPHYMAENKRRTNPGGPLDTHAAKELELFVENDADLYRQQYTPINKNLITKMARGVYNHAGAVKLFGYLMESGAKKYAKQFSVGSDWHQIFSPATRKAAAEVFARHFEVEAKLGNYDHLLPKKYASWRVPNGKLVDVKVKRNGRVYNGKARRVNGKVKVYVTPDVARKINPNSASNLPGLPSWNTYGGGTSAARGKYSYDIREGGKQYSISPFTTKYGRHAGYLLNVFPGTNYGHQGILPSGEPAQMNSQVYRSPQAAASAAKKYHQKYSA